MHLQVRLRMGSKLIKSHGDNINFSSPEGEEFPPSPNETLIHAQLNNLNFPLNRHMRDFTNIRKYRRLIGFPISSKIRNLGKRYGW